jgi:hypothetical protein
MGVLSNRDIPTNLPERDLGKFETIFECSLRCRSTASFVPCFEFRRGCVEASRRRHDDHIVSTMRRGAQRYGLRNCGEERERKFQIWDFTGRRSGMDLKLGVRGWRRLWLAPGNRKRARRVLRDRRAIDRRPCEEKYNCKDKCKSLIRLGGFGMAAIRILSKTTIWELGLLLGVLLAGAGLK